MKIISFANVKGGSGKTTSAALLSCGLVEQGYSVAVIDCDPLSYLYDWLTESKLRRVTAARVTRPNDLNGHVSSFRQKVDYIIIDLSGTSNVMNALAFALSDLVLIPMQGSAVDVKGAAHTIQLIRLVAENRRSFINTSVVLTRVSPLVLTNAMKYVTQIINDLDVPFLEVPILERSAYRDMFSMMTSLFTSSELNINNLSKARQDIGYLTDAIRDWRLNENSTISVYEGQAF